MKRLELQNKTILTAAMILAWAFTATAVPCLYSQENLGRGRITGQVVDESGQPIAGAVIKVQALDGASCLEGKSDKKGRFAVAGMGTGRWRVTARKDGYLESFIEMYVSQLKANPPLAFTLKKTGDSVVPAGAKADLETVERGNALAEEGKYDEAISAFEEFLARHPDIYHVRLNIAGACLKKGDLERAEIEFKAALDQIGQGTADYSRDKATAVRALSGLGEAALRRQDFAAAGEFFSRGLALSPDDEGAAFNVGEILFSNQKTDEAIKYFEMASRIKPGWSKPYHKLGLVYVNKGEYGKALENFKKFIELDPENPEVPAVKNIMAAIEKIKE